MGELEFYIAINYKKFIAFFILTKYNKYEKYNKRNERRFEDGQK